jgi:hypothetical protein
VELDFVAFEGLDGRRDGHGADHSIRALSRQPEFLALSLRGGIPASQAFVRWRATRLAPLARRRISRADASERPGEPAARPRGKLKIWWFTR